MGMALKADITQACFSSGASKPVDLVHLATQTMGDPVLETEVLSIFKGQCINCIRAYKASENAFEKKQAAHLLKGSARGIGAWHLADIAGQAEQVGFNDVAGLEDAANEVIAYIDQLRS